MKKQIITLFIITLANLLITTSVFSQAVGISGNYFDIDSSAILEIQSTQKGVLFPRMTEAQRDSISDGEHGYSAALSLLIYNTTTDCYEFWAYGDWHEIACAEQPFTCGDILTINHVAGDVAPETKTVNYGTVSTTLGGTGDKCWITRNLGADNQASSATDTTNASAGWYWQFNRKQGFKHDGTTRTPSTAWISSIDETSDWTAAQDPCTIELGAGWRIPTKTEWENADITEGWANYNDTYASVLKLHAAGWLYNGDGSLWYRGSSGFFWSSTQYISTDGWELYFDGFSSFVGYSIKANGFNLRCLRD